MERLLITVREAAELTGTGRSKAYMLVASGEWPRVRIGRSVRVPVDALREWVAVNTEMGSGAGAERNEFRVRQ